MSGARSARSGFRFLIASVGGLAFDVASARILVAAGVPVAAAGACSMAAAAVLMYVVHEKWTFDGGMPLSVGRLVATLWASAGAMCIRVACLWASSVLFAMGDRLPTLQLVAAAGASFVFSFLVVRRILGTRPATQPPERRQA